MTKLKSDVDYICDRFKSRSYCHPLIFPCFGFFLGNSPNSPNLHKLCNCEMSQRLQKDQRTTGYVTTSTTNSNFLQHSFPHDFYPIKTQDLFEEGAVVFQQAGRSYPRHSK